MRCASIASLLMLVAVDGEMLLADRVSEKREQADYVFSGIVAAVFVRETVGYRDYVIEINVERVEKGSDIKEGAVFRAFCYQRKEGQGGLAFDSAGHSTVPKEGQRVKAFVNRENGKNEGVYPDWVDIVNDAQASPTR